MKKEKIIDQGALGLNNDEISVIKMSELDIHNVKSETVVSEFKTLKGGRNSQTIVCSFSTWACFWVVLLQDDVPCDLKYYEDVTPLDYDEYTVRSVNAVLEHYIRSDDALLSDFVDICNLYFEQDIRQDCFSSKFMTQI